MRKESESDEGVALLVLSAALLSSFHKSAAAELGQLLETH